MLVSRKSLVPKLNRWIVEIWKGTDFLPQTQIVYYQYLSNVMVLTFDISNLDYLI